MEKEKLKYEKQHSAGGVPYRIIDGRIEVVIFLTSFKTPKPQWYLPKGWIDPGETPEVTAVREVQEEAGVISEVEDKIMTSKYNYVWEGTLVDKTVEYFLMKYVSGSPKDHGYEALDADWFEIDTALEKLDRENEKEVLRKAKELLVKKHSLD